MTPSAELVPPADAGRVARRWRSLLFLVALGACSTAASSTHDQIVDTPVYQRYGDAIDDGQVPYRDFALEYPPGALPVFVAARARERRRRRLPRRLRGG